MRLTLDEALAHIPGEVTPEIAQFAKDLLPRYIFTWRKSNRQYAYCTYCGNSWENKVTMYHNTKGICPTCHNERLVKASGRGHKSLWNDGYFVYYQKSRIDPDVITAVGWLALRDYCKGYRDVETGFAPKSLYVFVPGKGGTAFHRDTWYSTLNDDDHHLCVGPFQRAGSVKCQFTRGHLMNVWTGYSRESIARAVEGTPFQYSGWQEYDVDDMTEFFDLASKYPSVEYLTKLGFSELVEEKLRGWPTYSAVHWRGKTMAKVLRLSDGGLAAVRKAPEEVDALTLKILQVSRKDGSNITMVEAKKLKKERYIQELVNIPYGSLRKRLAYLAKQGADKDLYSYNSAYQTWRDYLEDCKKLEMDLTQDNVIFPRDLHRAHQNTIAQVKVKGDVRLDKKIKARLPKLREKYLFRYRGLLIRPATGTQEMINEGKALNHCVGTYADGYAKGKYDILVIRKLISPRKPFYTVQVDKDGKGPFVSQCRGKSNAAPTPQVEKFLDAFKAQKLNPSKEEVAV